ncbi:MAG: cytochrome-c oxidase, cbb3-type subunit III [Alphaproteobacteria bacterium]
MPTKGEKDLVTGTETTGHEWDGIRELDTPLPKWWLYVLYATILWALVYVVLYPAIPWGTGHSRGLLGWDQRSEFAERWSSAKSDQAGFNDKIAGAALASIEADPQLLTYAMAGGRAAFSDNCAPCHGGGGSGRKGGFPTLADDEWLWGGTLDQIQRTITYGIRNANSDSRQSAMPAFGADGVLTRKQVDDVAEYVLSLPGAAKDQAAAARGTTVFADNCAACHGKGGKGNIELGAPDLTDGIWLYGGSKEQIVAQVWRPKMGVMPAWEGRLDPTTIKMLTIYVHSLGGGQ